MIQGYALDFKKAIPFFNHTGEWTNPFSVVKFDSLPGSSTFFNRDHRKVMLKFCFFLILDEPPGKFNLVFSGDPGKSNSSTTPLYEITQYP